MQDVVDPGSAHREGPGRRGGRRRCSGRCRRGDTIVVPLRIPRPGDARVDIGGPQGIRAHGRLPAAAGDQQQHGEVCLRIRLDDLRAHLRQETHTVAVVVEVDRIEVILAEVELQVIDEELELPFGHRESAQQQGTVGQGCLAQAGDVVGRQGARQRHAPATQVILHIRLPGGGIAVAPLAQVPGIVRLGLPAAGFEVEAPRDERQVQTAGLHRRRPPHRRSVVRLIRLDHLVLRVDLDGVVHHRADRPRHLAHEAEQSRRIGLRVPGSALHARRNHRQHHLQVRRVTGYRHRQGDLREVPYREGVDPRPRRIASDQARVPIGRVELHPEAHFDRAPEG